MWILYDLMVFTSTNNQQDIGILTDHREISLNQQQNYFDFMVFLANLRLDIYAIS